MSTPEKEKKKKAQKELIKIKSQLQNVLVQAELAN